MSDYNYSITTDFPFQKANATRLDREIRDDATILTARSGVTISGDTVTCSFNGTLPAGEETALDAVIAAHSGEPLPEDDPIPVVIEPTGDLSKVIRVQGKIAGGAAHNFTAAKTTTTTHNISWGYDVELQGVEMITDGKHAWKDSVNVSLHHPIAGLLGTFGEGTWVHPSGTTSVIAEGTQTIPAGLILKVEYTSVGTVDDVDVVVNLRMWL